MINQTEITRFSCIQENLENDVCVQQPSYGMHSQLTFVNPEHFKDVAENTFVLQAFWCLIFYLFFLVSFIYIYIYIYIYPNLALYIYCYEIIILYLLYLIYIYIYIYIHMRVLF